MLKTTMLLISMLIVLCLNDVANGLGQECLDMMKQLIEKSPRCTVLLYKLDKTDSNNISAMVQKNPLLIIHGGKNIQYKERMQQLLSVKQSCCVLTFAMKDTLDENVLEFLLNQTKYRTVYVMLHKAILPQHRFQPYFLESVTFIDTSKLRSSILVTGQQTKTFIWKKNGKTMLVDTMLNTNADRRSLKNKNVTVSGYPFAPLVTLLPDKTVDGMELDIFKIVSKKMGFQYSFKIERDWLHKNPKTQEMEGSFASITSGRSQFAFETAQRSVNNNGSISFTPQIYYLDSNYLVPKPKPLKPFNNFVRPFTLTVWLCFLVSLISFSVTAFLFVNYNGGTSMSMARITLDLFGTIWQQKLKDSLVSPSSGVYFMIFGFWIIGMTFKGAAYSCNLRTFMLMKEYEKSIETDEDILKTNTDVYIYIGGGEIEAFKNSPSATKREIFARTFKRNTFVTVLSENVQPFDERMVREGGARFTIRLRNRHVLQSFERHFGYQPLQGTKSNTFSRSVVLGMSPHQPWNDEVNRVMFHLLASGIIDRFWRRNVETEKVVTKDINSDQDLESYKVEHVAGPLSVLGAGLMLSLVVFCFEAAHYYVSLLCFFRDSTIKVYVP